MKTELSKEILKEFDVEYSNTSVNARHSDAIKAMELYAKEFAIKYQQEKQKLDEAVELLKRASARLKAANCIGLPIEIDEFLTSHKSGGKNLEG